jgi:DNA-binding GntR family transcriptional regulator
VLADVLDERLRGTSRVELRDLAAHYIALAAMAAELAADRSSEDDVEMLMALVNSADISSVGLARRAENNFRLEVAALSQSARLVNEHVSLQADFGPLLWLNLRVVENRTHSRQQHLAVVAAIAAGDHESARRTTIAHLNDAVEWLIATKATLDHEERT